MEYPTLMYRVPGFHRGPDATSFDYKPAADEDAREALIEKGWHDSLDAARGLTAAKVDPLNHVDRDELEAKARDLGISFNWKTSDEALAERIAEKVSN